MDKEDDERCACEQVLGPDKCKWPVIKEVRHYRVQFYSSAANKIECKYGIQQAERNNYHDWRKYAAVISISLIEPLSVFFPSG